MHKIFNLINYKDRNFVFLLIATVLCFSSFQTVLVPSLDFIALNIKNSNYKFYNYATVASLALAIPQSSSLIAGYLVNNLVYKKLINLIFVIIIFISIFTFIYNTEFALYAIFVICCGILLNALYCGLDRQIVILLASKIREFQNDMFILGSILAIINYKTSNYIFVNLGIRGIIIYFMFFNIIIYLCLKSISAIDNIGVDSGRSALPNIITLAQTLAKHGKLILFWGIMLLIMFANAGLTLLLTTKIHHENLPTDLWSSNMSLMASGNLLGAILCKTRYIQRINSLIMVSVVMSLFGLCFLGISLGSSPKTLLTFLLICGLLSPCVLINMNSIFFKYIAKHEELITISPIINGCIASTFYTVCLLCPMILNLLLHTGISYTILLFACGLLEMLPAIFLLNYRHYFKALT